MLGLIGPQDPFPRQHVVLYEYNDKGERREVGDSKVLMDDPATHVTTKIKSLHPTTRVIWWVIKSLSSAEIQAIVSKYGRDVLPPLTGSNSSEVHTRVIETGWESCHVCPYLDGVFNVSIQGLHNIPAQAHDRNGHFQLEDVTSVAEVHYVISREDTWKSFELPTSPNNVLVSEHMASKDMDMVKSEDIKLREIVYQGGIRSVGDLGEVFESLVMKDFVAAVHVTRDSRETYRVNSAAFEKAGESSTIVSGMVESCREYIVDIECIIVNITRRILLIVLADKVVVKVAYPTFSDVANLTDHAIASIRYILKLEPVNMKMIRLVCNLMLPSVRMSSTQLLNALSKLPQYTIASKTYGSRIEIAYARGPGVVSHTPSISRLLERNRKNPTYSQYQLETVFGYTQVAAEKLIDSYAPSNDVPPVSMTVSSKGIVRMNLTASGVIAAQRAIYVFLYATSDSSVIAHNNTNGVQLSALDIIAQSDMEVDAKDAQGGPSGFNELIASDDKLFNFKPTGNISTYARQCGKVDQRQPIALTQEVASGIRQKMGEFSSLKAGNMEYACPEAWCNAEQYAMTRADAIAADWKCTDGSRAEDLMSSGYWKGAKTRHIGFLDQSKHPEGLCMPCCFKSSGRLQKIRKSKCGVEGANPAPVDDSTTHVLSASTSPVPHGRMAWLGSDFPDNALLHGVKRIGIDHKKHEFTRCVSVLLNDSHENVMRRIDTALTPTIVCTALRGDLMLQVQSMVPDNMADSDTRTRFLDYIKSTVGKSRMVDVGMSFSTDEHPDFDSPDMGREMVVWSSWNVVRRIISTGLRSDLNLISLMTSVALRRRFPIVDGLDNVVRVVCLHGDEYLRALPVSGLIARTDNILEPIHSVSTELLHVISDNIRHGCRRALPNNNCVSRYLRNAKHQVLKQVVGVGHIASGYIIEKDLFVPVPGPRPLDLSLPIIYTSSLPEAQWSVTEVKRLFQDIAQACETSWYTDVDYHENYVTVGKHCVPLQGGKLCARVARNSSLILMRAAASDKSEVTAETSRITTHERMLRHVRRHIMAKDKRAYIAITHHMSPLTPTLKQKLFDNMVSDMDGIDGMRYGEVGIRKPHPRRGELRFTEEDALSGMLDHVLSAQASGNDNKFRTMRIAGESMISSATLDKTVEYIPDGWSSDVINKAATSSLGNKAALEIVVVRAGGNLTMDALVDYMIQEAIMRYKVNGLVGAAWPSKVTKAIERASSGKSSGELDDVLRYYFSEAPLNSQSFEAMVSHLACNILLIGKHGRTEARVRVTGVEWGIVAYWCPDGALAFVVDESDSPVITTRSFFQDV